MFRSLSRPSRFKKNFSRPAVLRISRLGISVDSQDSEEISVDGNWISDVYWNLRAKDEGLLNRWFESRGSTEIWGSTEICGSTEIWGSIEIWGFTEISVVYWDFIGSTEISRVYWNIDGPLKSEDRLKCRGSTEISRIYWDLRVYWNPSVSWNLEGILTFWESTEIWGVNWNPERRESTEI